MNFNYEIELVEFFKKKNIFCIKKLAEEVPFFERNIDMVIIDNKDNLISIEFKLNDIKTVYKQAKKCLLCSDYVYICLPKKNLKKETIKKFKNEGIGIILVDENIEIKLKAQRSTKNFLKDKVLKNLLI